MKLTTTDLDYIDERLETHGLKYQEIYNEIRDHVILAIETARSAGDERAIESVYNDMMAVQFPGYYPFERISITYEKAYRARIKKTVWANVRYYLSPLNVIAIALVSLIAGYKLPETQTTDIVILVVFLIASVFPIIYARIKSAEIKTDNGRESIMREQIRNRALLVFFNFFVVKIVFLMCREGWHATLLGASNHNPAVDLFLIAFAVIYGLSIARLCRQEIKGPILNIHE